MSGVVHGQCLCGEVKISTTPARPVLGACHCGMCRSWASSMFISIPAGPDLEVSGPVKTFASSEWAERAFCSNCGSSLWYKITAPGPGSGQVNLSAGLFENAAGGQLGHELFIDKKPDGYAFAGDHETMTEAECFAYFAPDEGDQE